MGGIFIVENPIVVIPLGNHTGKVSANARIFTEKSEW
jgi:hypothetical protein